MKHLKPFIKFIFIFVLSVFLISCSNKKNQEEKQESHTELKSFMLGGIYFIKGYGGMQQVESMLEDAGMTTDSELIEGYEELLEFPFQASQASDIKSVLSEMWDINNKEELVKTLEELKTKEDKYKAWDYARFVNNACMGYATGYLTKEEAKSQIMELLPLAQEKYNDWATYFQDFEAGRKDWNANDPDSKAFIELSKTILESPKSIYNILPLK